MKLKESSTALVVGTFVAVLHAIWSLMVFVGFVETYLDWILGLHFLTNPYQVLPFNFVNAAILIGFTFVAGYAFGWVFATIWNKLHKG